MADFIKCDGCDNISPDSNGTHIANGWTEVYINSKWRRYNKFAEPKEYIFCKECLSYENNDPEDNAVKNFILKFKKVFK